MVETVAKIDGMMCGMCESHINQCIRSNFPVVRVKSSHKSGEAVVLSESELPREKLTKVINDTGYRLLSVASHPYEKGRRNKGKSAEEYKALSIKEFTKAASRYEGSSAGIYEMCRKDYPDILAELEREPFTDLLDAGCGPAPMISLLSEKYPDRHYTGIDLTPAMIEQAKKKNLPNATFVVGDCENLPFPENSFDAIICSMSFHHYPNPPAFFDSVARCLRPGGRLILRDMTSDNPVVTFFVNHLELPLANLVGKGDVKMADRKTVYTCAENAGLTVERYEIRKGMRLHAVIRKPQKQKN